jgi:hypothetical protein
VWYTNLVTGEMTWTRPTGFVDPPAAAAPIPPAQAVVSPVAAAANAWVVGGVDEDGDVRARRACVDRARACCRLSAATHVFVPVWWLGLAICRCIRADVVL